jgi:hypothetical protein
VAGIRKIQVDERLAAASRVRAQIAIRAPARWTVLLRSDDPSLWNNPAGTMADRSGFSANLDTSVSADITYLRLRRMDTGDAVFIAMKKDDLLKQMPNWCGSAWVGYGGTHLGVKNPNLKKLEKGLVDIDANYLGWGFGHIMYVPEGIGHGYAWAGVTLSKTVFEIAVTSDELNPLERRALVEVK